MRKVILALALLAVAGVANATAMTLIAHNQVSGGGALSTLIWNGSNATTTGGMTVSAMASTATWDWDGVDTLTSSGYFQTTSHVSSMTALPAVISDVVVDMVIDTTANTTGATSYECREGNFLSTVGAHGCANITLGANAAYDSSVAYNVGGDANCVVRSLNDHDGDGVPLTPNDDVSTGAPRGLSTPGSGGSCDTAAGAFDLWTVALDEGAGPGKHRNRLILSNGICMVAGSTCGGANFLTLQYVPVPAAVWLFGSALGLLGWVRRRACG
jgi:hypothetical protein